MKNQGYGEFFKKAKAASGSGKKPRAAKRRSKPSRQKESAPEKRQLNQYSEKELRAMFKLDQPAPKKKSSIWKSDLSTAISFVGASALVVFSIVFIVFFDGDLDLLSKFEVQMMGQAKAQDQEKTADKDKEKMEESAEDQANKKDQSSEGVQLTEEEKLSYFGNLNERKRELDLREKELAELERELQKQKEQVESRIEYLESVRRNIAGVLQERVEMDEEKVKQLVDFYSNMKPAQAATIISDINEELAINVLSKMKKKNAAQIMNMIEPGKARALSEKFAGYKPKKKK